MSLTFKQYLEEKVVKKWQHDKLSVDEAVDLLNTHCKNGLRATTAKNGLIFRGFGKTKMPKFSIIDSSNAVRTSRDYSGAYQICLENSIFYKHLPSRTSSLICSTDIDIASNYVRNDSEVRVLIPFDGTMITTSTADDFIRSEISGGPNNGNNLAVLDSDLRVIFEAAGIKEKKYTPVDTPKINNALKNVDRKKIKRVVKERFWVNDRVAKILATLDAPNPLEALSTLMLGKNALKIALREFGNPLFEGECWFTGKCIALDIKLYNEIAKELKVQFGINAQTFPDYDNL